MSTVFNWINDAGNGFVSANTTLTTSKGANTINSGDLLIVVVAVEGNVGTITPPAGFTLFNSQQLDAQSYTWAVFWKVAGGSETGSYTFTWTGSNFMGWSLMNLSGAHATTPIGQSGTNTITASLNFTTPSITPTGSADFLICGFFDNAAVLTLPGGMTVQANNVNLESGTIGYSITTLQLANNSAVSKTATIGSAKDGATFIAAITPAAAGGARTPTLTLMGVG